MQPNASTKPGRAARYRAFGRTAANALYAGRWFALVGLAIVAFVLGVVGFAEYFDDIGVDKTGSDLVYLSLQLFTLESGSVPDTGAPWQLEVARLAAPATTATALIAALLVAFRQQIADWRLHREHDHVVICGLGTAGARLAGELLDANRRVVGIEYDGASPAADALRQRGAALIIGDARNRDVLQRARIDRATHLVCLTGSDDVNAAAALAATDLCATRKGPALSCLAQIRDPDLCVLMRSEELAAGSSARARLDFFNVDERGARLMLDDHSPFAGTDGPQDPPRVLVVGLNRLGQNLVAELARRWRAHPEARGRQIAMTVLDPAATKVIERLRYRYPLLSHAAQLSAIDAELGPTESDLVSTIDASIAYVCMDDDSAALQAALRVRRALADREALVVVELIDADGIGRLIDRPEHSDHLRAFDVLGRTMQPDLLLGGTYELLARAIHEEYLASQARLGATVETNPSMAPWDELPDALKESNRDQAAHIGVKMAAIGRGIAPLTHWDAEGTKFTNEEVELLAELEHERWVRQRKLDQWTPGPRDSEAKTTPYLVPWDTLSEEVKELDRRAVRNIPSFLTRAGYQIVSPDVGAP